MKGGRWDGVLLGLIGVVCFSITLPAMRIAVPQLGPVEVGLGRALVAAALAGAVLAIRREPFPRKHALAIFFGGLGVIVGFPLFVALALRSVPSVHAAVIVGFSPAATAIFAVLRGGERPSRAFWAGALLGLIAIVVFAEVEGAGHFAWADVYLLIAVATSAYGYAEGGRIARELGGWRVISWSLVLIAPLLIVPVAVDIAARGGLHADARAWVAFGWTAVVSMYLSFFAWYAGLARGGIARVGQLQLVQAPLTLLWGVLLLGERVVLPTILAALLVIASAALSQRLRVAPAPSGA